jgi:FkbM family methyltransferase
MSIPTAFKNLLYVLRRVFDRFIRWPVRRKILDAKGEMFLHKTTGGLLFFVDPSELIDRFIFVEGIFERRFLENLRGKFGAGAIALDVGANIGNHSIYLHDQFSTIHAFEPNPRTFARLQKNIDANDLSSLVAHQVALGDSDAELVFGENLGGNLGNSGFVDEVGSDSRFSYFKMMVFNADDYLRRQRIDRVDFIKIDVEGFEPKVFCGLRETIKRFRPIIAFEYHGHLAKVGDYDKIVECLPGYLMFELTYAPETASLIKKLIWNFKHGVCAEFKAVNVPELRSYDNIIAFPSIDVAERFILFRADPQVVADSSARGRTGRL